jgi:hypothetical protein
MVRMKERRARAQYSVKNMETKYTVVAGARSGLHIFFIWAQGPMRNMVLPMDIMLPKVKAIANFLGTTRNTETAKKLKKNPMARQVAKPISLFVRDNDSSSVKFSTKDLGGSGSPPPMRLRTKSEFAYADATTR